MTRKDGKVQIVAMAREHLPRVLEIERVSFDAPWNRQLFVREIDEESAHFYVLLSEEQVVGYAGFWLIFDEIHITNIALDPARRGRGYGKRLLEYVHSQAAALGAEKASLEVRTGNDVAIGLYKSFGYIPVAIRKNYYIETEEDAVVMWKTDLGGSKVRPAYGRRKYTTMRKRTNEVHPFHG